MVGAPQTPSGAYSVELFSIITLELSATVESPEPILTLGLDVRLRSDALQFLSATRVGQITSTIPTNHGSVTLPWMRDPICPAFTLKDCTVSGLNPVPSIGLQPRAFSGVLATATARVTTFSGSGLITVELPEVLGVPGFFGAAPPSPVRLSVFDPPIPEPGTGALLALGLVGLSWRGPRRRESQR